MRKPTIGGSQWPVVLKFAAMRADMRAKFVQQMQLHAWGKLRTLRVQTVNVDTAGQTVAAAVSAMTVDTCGRYAYHALLIVAQIYKP